MDLPWEIEEMVRTLRDAKVDSRSGRSELKPAPNPYWIAMGPNQSIGYNKPRKGAGTWRARLYLPASRTFRKKALGTADDFQDANGSSILSFKQAQSAAASWFAECHDEAIRVAGGEPAQVGPYTVEDAMRDYFQDAKRRGVRGVIDYEKRSNLLIVPPLGSLEVAKLTRRRIESWLAEMADAPRRIRTKKTAKEPVFAPAPKTDDERRARRDTANRILTILKSALNHALDRRRASSGEAWQRVKPYRGTTKARVQFLNVEDQVRLVNVCPPDFRQLVKGALFTGGRYGELGRVTVQDFDPTGGTLFLIGKGTAEGKPRRVVLTEEGQAFFRGLTAGRPTGELIFLRETECKRKTHLDRGQAWGNNEQSRFMKAACEAAEMAPFTFHELRHSYASMLVNAGCPLAYVAAQLGHSDTRMVEKHYGHLAPNALADSVRALMPKLGFHEAAKVAPLKVSGAL